MSAIVWQAPALLNIYSEAEWPAVCLFNNKGHHTMPLKEYHILREKESMVYSVFSFLLRKNPPITQIRTATPATIADPTMPDTVVPAAESLPGKA